MIAHVAWRLSRRAMVNLWRAPLPSLVSVLTISLSLFIGAMFEGYLLGTMTVQVFALYIYLTLATFVQDYVAVSESMQAEAPPVEEEYAEDSAELLYHQQPQEHQPMDF